MLERDPRPPLKILVVEDNIDAAATLRILLELWGHTVRVAYNGIEGLRVAPSFDPDVVLLDIEMPQMHGGEVARRLRRLPGFQRVWIIATSGTDPDDPRLAGYSDQFDDYLPKPYNLERLEQLLGVYTSDPPCDSSFQGGRRVPVAHGERRLVP
jgi:CheY-like chemotaxis protein